MAGLNIESSSTPPLIPSVSTEGSSKSNQTVSIKGHTISQSFQKFATNLINKIKSLFSSHVSKSTELKVLSKTDRKITQSKSDSSDIDPEGLTAKELKAIKKRDLLIQNFERYGFRP